jgi:hypothetical protein
MFKGILSRVEYYFKVLKIKEHMCGRKIKIKAVRWAIGLQKIFIWWPNLLNTPFNCCKHLLFANVKKAFNNRNPRDWPFKSLGSDSSLPIGCHVDHPTPVFVSALRPNSWTKSHRARIISPLPLRVAKTGRNHLKEEFTPLLPTGIGERF